MKAFLIGLLAWSASAYFAAINTLPVLAPAITLLGWYGSVVCILALLGKSAERFLKETEKEKGNQFPRRKADIEVTA